MCACLFLARFSLLSMLYVWNQPPLVGGTGDLSLFWRIILYLFFFFFVFFGIIEFEACVAAVVLHFKIAATDPTI